MLLCDGDDVQQPVGAALVGDVLCAVGILPLGKTETELRYLMFYLPFS